MLEKGADTEIKDAKGMRVADYAKDQRMIDLLNNYTNTGNSNTICFKWSNRSQSAISMKI